MAGVTHVSTEHDQQISTNVNLTLLHIHMFTGSWGHSFTFTVLGSLFYIYIFLQVAGVTPASMIKAGMEVTPV